MGNLNTSEENIDKLRKQTKAYRVYTKEREAGDITAERTMEYERLADEEIAIKKEDELVASEEAIVIIGPRVIVEMSDDDLKKRREQTKSYIKYLTKTSSIAVKTQVASGYNKAALLVSGDARKQILDTYGHIIEAARKELATLPKIEAEYIIAADVEIDNDLKAAYEYKIMRKVNEILREKETAARKKKWDNIFDDDDENDVWDKTFLQIADDMGNTEFCNFIFGKLKECEYKNIWVYYRNILNHLHKYGSDNDQEYDDMRHAMITALGDPDIDYFHKIFTLMPSKVTADLILDMMSLEEIPSTFISIEDGKIH